MRRRLWQLSVVLLAVVLAGCSSGSGGTKGPSPSLSPAGPTVSASGYDEALFAEAERVYRAMRAAQAKYELTGDYSEFPPELVDLLSPDYLEKIRLVFERAKSEGWVLTGDYPELVVSPLPRVSKDGSEIAVLSCFDGRGMVARDASGRETAGQMVVGTYYLKHFDGALKIFSSDSYESNQCPIP